MRQTGRPENLGTSRLAFPGQLCYLSTATRVWRSERNGASARRRREDTERPEEMNAIHSRKKLNERKIFEMVYGEREFAEVVASERPDFLVRRCPGEPCFGVEIVELYTSESSARLKNIEPYTGELLDHRKFRHKDDKRCIDVAKIDLLSRDNQVIAPQIDAIIERLPSCAECSERLAEVVNRKAEGLGSIPAPLSHANLIVKDQTSVLGLIPLDDFDRAFMAEGLQRAIASAPFREIFFVTKMKPGRVVIRLKLLQIVAGLYTFNAVYSSKAFSKLPKNAEVATFGAYFAETVGADVRMRMHQMDGHEVVYGDYGIRVTSERAVCVRFYDDGPLPSDARQVDRDILRKLPPKLVRECVKRKARMRFSTGLIFRVGDSRNPITPD